MDRTRFFLAVLVAACARPFEVPPPVPPVLPGRVEMLVVPGQKALYLGGGCNPNTGNLSTAWLCPSANLSDLWLGNLDPATMGF